MQNRHSIRTILFFCLWALIIFGCGGSDDNSSPNGSSNLAPIADAGGNQVVLQGTLVILDGSSSLDEDGQIVSYHWLQTRGREVLLVNADTESPAFTAPLTDMREELDFQLTVKDDGGAQSSDTVTITVNIPPIADAGANQTLFLGNPSTETVALTGIAADSDGTVMAHQWDQIDGPIVNLSGDETPTASFSVPPTTAAYTFSYTVTDNDGAQATDTVTVYVTRIIFSDSFSDGSGWQNRWSIVDDTPNPGDWRVTEDGQLLQDRKIESVNSFQSSTAYHLGSYALLVDPTISGIASYRFSVDILPLPNTTGLTGNDVGIMFRYQNELNYYRVALNARYGFTRFEKRKNGFFETLAVNAIGHIIGEPLTLAAEVNGDSVIVWVNGNPVFALVDGSISMGGIALYCQDKVAFDNVIVTHNPLQPVVALSTPLAYSVALTRDEGDALTVEAVALNKPIGGNVEFSLYNINEDSETIEPAMYDSVVYFADFFNLPAGEYDVMVILRDSNGKEVSHDINSMVGVGGDYIVTVGDSITNGIGDYDPFNNDSADGRIVARQGFQAPLADQLTETTNLPQIVFNEGIGGDTAFDLATRIDSILERHPGANKVLLMIGTNDANRGVTPTTFRNQVLETVAKINGRQVWIAKPMPTFINDEPISWTLDTTRNNRIQQYNLEINQIAANDPNTYLGPDFYSLFYNRTELYSGYLHPNDFGYHVMADEWHNVLAP